MPSSSTETSWSKSNTTNQPIDEQIVVGGEVLNLQLDRSNATAGCRQPTSSWRLLAKPYEPTCRSPQITELDGTLAIRAAVTNGSIDLG